MIDVLLEQDERYTLSNFEVTADNLFVEDGEFKESGIIENIAQTAAAGAGYLFLQKNVFQPSTFIGSLSKLKIHRYPKVGDTLTTRTEIVTIALNISLLKGECFLNNELIAECELKMVSSN